MSVDWEDVARFVGAYMDRRPEGRMPIPPAPDSLLDEITDAYMADRGLAAGLRTEVLSMVDSVL